MVEDLIANHLKTGMTRAQVAELLGEKLSEESLEYVTIDVGAPPNESIGCNLHLEFDAAGLFQRAYIQVY